MEQEKKRSLRFLKSKSATVLDISTESRQKFIEIATNNTPSQAYELTVAYVRSKTSSEELFYAPEDYAKSCRFLAVIRRDYGEDAFTQVTQEIKPSNNG